MPHVPVELRRLVVVRAASRCEYCGLAQAGQEATFHIDHVIPLSAKGSTAAENLALACVSCSLRKAARLNALDRTTGRVASLFNPRTDSWRDHSRWDGPRLVGLTPTGRATIEALHMNRPLVLGIREEEARRGRHPASPN